jgi:hypothetical protein
MRSNFEKAQTEVIKWLKNVQLERKKKMSDQITSYIRTVVPYAIGAIVAWLAAKGINVPEDLIAPTTALITAAAGTLYYIVVRKLEQKWPKLGVLLGVAKTPEYK